MEDKKGFLEVGDTMCISIKQIAYAYGLTDKDVIELAQELYKSTGLSDLKKLITNMHELPQHLQLTNADYDLICKGLDGLMGKGVPQGEGFIDRIFNDLSKDSAIPDGLRKAMSNSIEKDKAAKILQDENVKILQGKLLSIKRHYSQLAPKTEESQSGCKMAYPFSAQH